MCQYGRIKIFYKVENKLARQRLQNKTGKEEGTEPKETGQQVWQCKNGIGERRKSPAKSKLT